MNQVILTMDYKKYLLVLFIFFYTSTTFSEIIYNKNNLIITNIDLNNYRNGDYKLINTVNNHSEDIVELAIIEKYEELKERKTSLQDSLNRTVVRSPEND